MTSKNGLSTTPQRSPWILRVPLGNQEVEKAPDLLSPLLPSPTKTKAALGVSLFQTVTKSKLILLTARQTSKSRDKLLGQGITTLFKKPADREDGGLVFQRTIAQVRIQASFILKGKEVWLVVADFLVPESFVLAAVHIGLDTMFL